MFDFLYGNNKSDKSLYEWFQFFLTNKAFNIFEYGGEKIFIMKFADDIVLIANHPEGPTSIIKTLEKFVKKKKLTINIKKIKVLIFKKGDKNKKGDSWKYNDVQLVIVKEYKYLKVWFSTGNTFEKHIKKNTEKIIKTIII